MKAEELEIEIMRLSPEARAALAEKIILSLEESSESENERLWVAEAERRLKEMRQGVVTEVPAEEVFRRAKAAIS
jgi:putative addiction module component (TIGR02574 family)